MSCPVIARRTGGASPDTRNARIATHRGAVSLVENARSVLSGEIVGKGRSGRNHLQPYKNTMIPAKRRARVLGSLYYIVLLKTLSFYFFLRHL